MKTTTHYEIKAINGTWVVIANGLAVFANGSKANCQRWVQKLLEA